MKKLYSFIAAACLCCASLTGCVEDNQSVILNGLVGGETCNTTGDNTYMIGDYSSSFSCDFWQCVSISQVLAYVNVTNNNISESVWSSSSSSSTGSTLDYDIPNTNMVYIDKVKVKCDSVDGDSSKCKGAPVLEYKMNVPVKANGGACHRIVLDLSQFLGLLGDKVDLAITAEYHDTGNISGKTNKTIFTLYNSKCEERIAAEKMSCAPLEDGANCVSAEQCAGGICDPNDAGVRHCSSPKEEGGDGEMTPVPGK